MKRIALVFPLIIAIIFFARPSIMGFNFFTLFVVVFGIFLTIYLFKRNNKK